MCRVDGYLGNVYKNSKGLGFEVIEVLPERYKQKKVYKIRFIESGYTANALSGEIRSGLIRDKLQKNLFGVACLGYGSVKKNEYEYRRWFNIIKRCYDETDVNYKRYGGKGVTVCDRWFRFDNFLEDLPHIEGYEKDCFNSGLLHIDKDIKQQGVVNKIYSLETCCFVTKEENDKFRDLSRPELEKSFKYTKPDGTEGYARNAYRFAKERGLDNTCIWMCMEGRINTHKGWKFERMS